MQTLEQARVFLGMMLTGALLGAVYDTLMLLRRGLNAGRMLTGALDLLFGAMCAAGICLSALIMRTEAFRWYVFAGVLGGMGLYFASAGALVRWLCQKGWAWRRKKAKNRGEDGK
ncbi:MAG: spore cortex biosynthesis protein YabQ [Clostridia bacterium]|nr:spore cortex biosynthesis protein YabQ [Clostridia bacterium]